MSDQNKTDNPRILRRKKGDALAAAARRRRVFLALPLTDEVRDAIAEHVRPIRDKTRSFWWVHPSRWQITVKRFGELEPEAVEPLGNHIQTAVGSAIPVEFRGLGATPDLREAESLWVGIRDPKNGLNQLHRRVNDACARLGYELETRRFRPQLSMARLERDQRPRPVARELSPVMDVLMSSTVLDEMVLYRVDEGRDGPVHVPIRRYRLGSL